MGMLRVTVFNWNFRAVTKSLNVGYKGRRLHQLRLGGECRVEVIG